MSEQINKAKDTLLRALEQLDKAREDLDGETERVDLIVIYEIGRDTGDGGWESIGGWSSTSGPKWMHAAMLRRAADGQDEAVQAVDDEPPDSELEDPPG